MTTKLKKRIPSWITKEGESIPISGMATHHLLNTIHMIERNRMQSLISIEQHGIFDGPIDAFEVLEYYAKWPNAYEDLLDEAERRHLIKRAKR